jgi:DNA-binding XRE family transcriptional regulator
MPNDPKPKDPELAAIGHRIRTVRNRRGITQLWLATRAEISKQAMYAIEVGRADAKATRIARIAKALRVSTDYLLGLKDEEIVDDRWPAGTAAYHAIAIPEDATTCLSRV